MSTTFSLIATKCPALPSRAALLDYTAGTPALGPDESGQSVVSKTRINQISKKSEAVAATGAGAYAVVYGLALSDSGTALTAAVAAGQAVIDGPVTLASPGTVVLADNAYNWLYLLQSGTLTKTSSGTDTPPAAPSSTCVFLGRIQVTAGVQSSPDGSGVLYFRGGALYRRTGDAGVPGDTPPAYVIQTQTTGGIYLWDGGAYRKGLNSGSVTSTELAAASVGSSALAPSAQALLLGAPTITPGTQVTHTRPVTVQVKDSGGVNVAAKRLVRVWLSDTALGGETTTVPDGGVSTTTGVQLFSVTTNKHLLVITDATGAAVVAITHSAAFTWHVIAEIGGQIADAAVALT